MLLVKQPQSEFRHIVKAETSQMLLEVVRLRKILVSSCRALVMTNISL